MWARFEDVPECSTFRIVHHELEMGGCLKGTEEVRGPQAVVSSGA